jgi:hypothetical protein
VAIHEASTLTEAIHAAARKLEDLVAHELRRAQKLPSKLPLNGESGPITSK